MKRLTISLFVCLISALWFPAKAQFTDYIFTSTTGTYTPITGNLSTAVGDDGAQNVALPFPFKYNRIPYTTVRICTNGWLEMGYSYLGSEFINDLASTTVKPLICPLWDDLYNDLNGDIQYTTLGTAPTRIFVVQWRKIRWKSSSGTFQNFQVRLHETYNKVEIVYGPMNAPLGSPSASIGINDEIGGAGHFMSVTPGPVSTVSTTVANDYVSNTLFIQNGRIFSFMPPPPANWDLAVLSLDSPAAYCGLSSAETISIKIKNNGLSTINNAQAYYQIDNNPVVGPENITTSMLAMDVINFTFNAKADLTHGSPDTTYLLQAWVNIFGDEAPKNDSIRINMLSKESPAPPTGVGDTVNYGFAATVYAHSPDTVFWFDLPQGGTIINAGEQYNTPVLFDTTTYYAESKAGGTPNLEFIVGNSAGSNTYSSYPTPYANFTKSARQQYLITAAEMTAAGYGPGPINGLAFNVLQVNNCAPMTDYSIKMGSTALTVFGTTWITGMTAVYNVPTYTIQPGWNWHDFTVPYIWDGSSSVVIETCFSNATSSTQGNASVSLHMNSAKSYMITKGSSSVCALPGNPQQGTISRPDVMFKGTGTAATGCSSVRTPVTVVVNNIPLVDASVSQVFTPVSGINMTATEQLKIKISNYGISNLSSFTVSYQINSNPVVTQAIAGPIIPGGSMLYTFPGNIDLEAYGTYNFKIYTTEAGDFQNHNDTMSVTVINSPPAYCSSTATATIGADIGNVTFATIFNGNPAPSTNNNPNANKKYSDFTSTVTPPKLSPGGLYPISITQINSGAWIGGFAVAFIDFNRDGIFDPTSEKVFGAYTDTAGGATTVTGNCEIPMGALQGFTRMRIVLRENGNETNTLPCNIYTNGETEDYLVEIMPRIPFDIGVIAINSPTVKKTVEGTMFTVSVLLKNYGLNAVSGVNVAYSINGGPAVTQPYPSLLTSGQTAQMSFTTQFAAPYGNINVCANTLLSSDTNVFNDVSCFSMFADAAMDATIVDFMEPIGGCGMDAEHPRVKVKNLGKVTIPANTITVSVKVKNTTTNIASQVFNQSLAPMETKMFYMDSVIDLSANIVTQNFILQAYPDFPADPIQSNDTMEKMVISLYTPMPPVSVNCTTAYGTSGTITAHSPVGYPNDTVYWYATALSQEVIDIGPEFVTPVIYETFSVNPACISYGGENFPFVIDQGTLSTNTANTFPCPYGTFNNSVKHQFLIKASELTQTGMGAGNIEALSFYIEELASQSVSNIEIYIGTTTATSLTNWITSPPLFYAYINTNAVALNVGWNKHTFTAPYLWNGTSNLVVQVCFKNTTHSSNHKMRLVATPYVSSKWYATNSGTACTSTANTGTASKRPAMVFHAKGATGTGCIGNRDTGWAYINPASIPAYDISAKTIMTPVSDFGMGDDEIVKIRVRNYGSSPVSSFVASYQINDTVLVSENVNLATPISPFTGTYDYSFSQRAYMIEHGFYSFKAWVKMSPLDFTANNDTANKTVNNMVPTYCPSVANTPNGADIGNVQMSNVNVGVAGSTINNPASVNTYTDNTSYEISLIPGNVFPISITQINQGEWVDAYVKVYIDKNRNGTFETTDEVFAKATSIYSPTISGNITIPASIQSGKTMMRVVLNEGGTAANTEPCTSIMPYNNGETEDYTIVFRSPKSYDLGITTISYPTNGVPEMDTLGIWIKLKNYGSLPLSASDTVKFVAKIDGIPVGSISRNIAMNAGVSSDVLLGFFSTTKGVHTVCVDLEYSKDLYDFNNHYCKYFNVVERYDLSINEIITPANLTIDGKVEPEIEIQNVGGDTLENFRLRYEVMDVVHGMDTMRWGEDVFTATLLPGMTVPYKFSKGYTPLIVRYSFCAKAIVSGDLILDNNELCKGVHTIKCISLPYKDSLEDPDKDYWYTLRDPPANEWELGTPNASIINTTHSGTKVWATVLNGNYTSNAFDTLYSPLFDFANAYSPEFSFWQWRDMEMDDSASFETDGGYLQYSKNMGEDWRTLGFYSDVHPDTAAENWYNTFYNGRDYWAGSTSGWVQSKHKMLGFDTLSQKVQLRYIFRSSTNNNMNGWAIDDFEISTKTIPRDAGVLQILTPVENKTYYDTSYFIKVRYKNFGLDTLYEIPIVYRIDENGVGGNPQLEICTDTLVPGAIAEYTFNKSYSGPFNNYIILAYTELSEDMYFFNDTAARRRITSLLVVPGVAEFDETRFFLQQNIPNPSSDQTIIHYGLPKAGEMRFTVRNTLGLAVYTLKEEQKAGDNSIVLDLKDYSPGIYYYVLEMNGRRLVKRMVVTK